MIDIKNPSDLQEQVLSANVAVLDFWAPWCNPCRALMPALEALQANNPSLVIGKVNVDENQGLAKASGIRSIPSLVLFKNGEAVDTLTGVHGLERLQKFIDSANG